MESKVATSPNKLEDARRLGSFVVTHCVVGAPIYIGSETVILLIVISFLRFPIVSILITTVWTLLVGVLSHVAMDMVWGNPLPRSMKVIFLTGLLVFGSASLLWFIGALLAYLMNWPLFGFVLYYLSFPLLFLMILLSGFFAHRIYHLVFIRLSYSSVELIEEQV